MNTKFVHKVDKWFPIITIVLIGATIVVSVCWFIGSDSELRLEPSIVFVCQVLMLIEKIFARGKWRREIEYDNREYIRRQRLRSLAQNEAPGAIEKVAWFAQHSFYPDIRIQAACWLALNTDFEDVRALQGLTEIYTYKKRNAIYKNEQRRAIAEMQCKLEDGNFDEVWSFLNQNPQRMCRVAAKAIDRIRKRNSALLD